LHPFMRPGESGYWWRVKPVKAGKAIAGGIVTTHYAGGLEIHRGWCRVGDGTISAADVLGPQIDPPAPGKVRVSYLLTSAECGRYAECVAEDRPAKG
jgi:hypothetical protein